jgi:hypothetical protein
MPDFRAMSVPYLVAALALLGSCSGEGDAGGASPALPVVTTLGSQVVSTSQETVHGSINPNGRDAEYWFEWGTDSTLANPSKTATKTLAASSSPQDVSDTLTGLTAGTKVYYRLSARNPDVEVKGDVKASYHYANVVFATSATGTGNLGSWANAGGKTGREAGDAICQSLASGAGLPGTFKAWLSDSAGAAAARLAHSTARYMRVDGVAIGNSWADFTTTPYLDNPIDRDERGLLVDLPGVPYWVFTETRVGGTTGLGMGGNACQDWTSGVDPDRTADGHVHDKDYQWTESGILACRANARLYCFQQNFDLPQEHSSTGCAGPIGWTWHVSACTRGLYQDPECKYVCCNFYNGTSNCNNVPASFGGYTVTSCSYNTGVYSMAVTHAGQSFNVSCELH